MARTFTSIVELQGAMEQCCTVAIQNACEILLAELQRLIRSEFYDQYTPSQYDRTDQFFNSAVKEMVTDLCGRVFVHISSLNLPLIFASPQIASGDILFSSICFSA